MLCLLSPQDEEIVYAAISCHNLPKVPENPNQRCFFHSMILRDADKLDILKVMDDYYNEKDKFPNPALEMGLPDTPEYSRDLINDILNNRIASTAEARTCNDLRLTRLSWVFDMNFYETFRLLMEKEYIEKTIAKLPQNNEIEKVHDHLKKYVASMISDMGGENQI